MKRNVVSWAALVVSTAALISSRGVLKTVPAAPQFVGESQKTAQELSDAFVGVADFVKPSVVSISATKKMPKMSGRMNPFGNGGVPRNGNPHNNIDPKELEEMLKKFFGGEEPNLEPQQFGGGTAHATGTGFVFDDKGHILTNNHVVADTSEIKITFNDGEVLPATIVGTDPKTDVAVIKVDSSNYAALPKGSSAKLKVGELVMAVGSPFGFEQSVTTGIVSALGRSNTNILSTPNAFEDFIQTDAAINPGNSGGPLVDMSGRVIGINSAIATSSHSSSGVGFAIPIDLAANIAERLIKDGKVKRVAIGIALQQMTPVLAREFGFDPKAKGVLVNQVFPNSPAAKAGIEKGDIITKFDDVQATRVAEFRNYLATSEPSKPHTVTYIRNGETKTCQVTLGDFDLVLAGAPGQERIAKQEEKKPAAEPEKKEKEEKKVELGGYGLEVQELTPELAKSFGYKGDIKGLLVSKVAEDTPAHAAGIRQGMLITTAVKDHKTQSVDSLKQFQNLTNNSKELTFYVQSPDGVGKFVPLAKPAK